MTNLITSSQKHEAAHDRGQCLTQRYRSSASSCARQPPALGSPAAGLLQSPLSLSAVEEAVYFKAKQRASRKNYPLYCTGSIWPGADCTASLSNVPMTLAKKILEIRSYQNITETATFYWFELFPSMK